MGLRRLPVYLVVDCSFSLYGEPLDQVNPAFPDSAMIQQCGEDI